MFNTFEKLPPTESQPDIQEVSRGPEGYEESDQPAINGGQLELFLRSAGYTLEESDRLLVEAAKYAQTIEAGLSNSGSTKHVKVTDIMFTIDMATKTITKATLQNSPTSAALH